MSKLINSLLIGVIASLFLFLPAEIVRNPPTAVAASGATYLAPPNYNFEAGPRNVGDGPANYDFSNGGASWTTVSGNVSYSSGVATLSGSNVVLISSSYTLAAGVQSIKIRYKAGAPSNAVVAIRIDNSLYGSDNLSCVNCTAGEWVEKYISVYPPELPSQSAQIQITQSSTTDTTEIDWVGTQWISFEEWSGGNSGPKSQPKQAGSRFAEIRGELLTGTFVLQENRLEFDYSFPLSSGNALTVQLKSGTAVLQSTSLTANNPVAWTRAVWSWGSDYIGQSVYVRFSSTESQPSWVDNVGVNFADAASRPSVPSEDGGDPFDTSSGQFTHSHLDVVIPGRGLPLEFRRTYNSFDAIAGDLGYNWRHTYSAHLRVDSDNSVTMYYGSGAAYFKHNSGSYTPPADVHDTLAKNGDGSYTLTTVRDVDYNFTSIGKLSSIVDRNGNTTTMSYDGNGYLTEVQDPAGRTLTFTPDANGRISEVEDPLGRTIGFEYDTNGDLVEVTDVKGGTTTYTYSSHRLTSLTDANQHLQTQTIYDGASRVVEQTDASGGKTCAYYGAGPSYTSQACPGVSPAPAAGQTVLVNPRGYKTTYDFDMKFRTTSITDHNGGVTGFGYDAENNRTCVTDPNGNKTGFDHDSSRNVIEIIDANNTDSYCGLASGGVIWEFEYTDLNDIEKATDPLGHVVEYVYDSAGNLTRVIRHTYDATLDQDGDGWSDAVETTLGTDETDNCPADTTANNENPDAWPPDLNDTKSVNISDVLALKPVFGTTVPPTSARYDLVPSGSINITDVLALKAWFGLTCPYTPTPLQLTCFEIEAGTGLVDATVESTNRVVPGSPTGTCTGNKTRFEYDAYDNLQYVTNPRFTSGSPPKTELETDLGGRVLSVTNELGHATAYTYDQFNMLLTVTDELGNLTTNSYDAKGNLVAVTDANRAPVGEPEEGAECGSAGTGDGDDDAEDSPADGVADDGCPNYIYMYDAADRLQDVIDTLGNSTIYTHDEAGNLDTVTDANHQLDGTPEAPADCMNGEDDDSDNVPDDGCPSTVYTYDSLNRLQNASDALGLDTEYQYDDASNLISRTDAIGQVTEYFPDNLNRLDEISYGVDGSVDYSYDDAGNRTEMIDDSGTTGYVYDPLNRVINVSHTGDQAVSYSYDAVGNRNSVGFLWNGDDFFGVEYTFNKDHSMYKAILNHQSATYTATYTYNDASYLIKAQLPNGVWADYEYDDADRLENVYNRKAGPTTISSYQYTLDAVGNRTQVVAPDGTHQYEYDPLYRLSEVTYPDPETDAYTYDAVGNRLSLDSTSYTYDVANNMITAGSDDIDHDENGNVTHRGSDTFDYDRENRLIESVIDSVMSTSVYNGDGLRMSHTVGSNTTDYLWDVNAPLPVVLSDGEFAYFYGLDLIASVDTSGNFKYFTYDGIGSTSELTNSSATVTDTYSYDVFGALRGSTGSTQNPWLFTGEQEDPDGLYYLRARYYDPATGRFLTRDPVSGFMELPSTQNPYSYALGNPANLTDPSGRFSLLGFLIGLRPIFACLTTDFSCIGDYLGVITQYNEFVRNVLEPFATLNCLSAALSITAVTANILLPGSGAAVTLALWSYGAYGWAASSTISLAQIDGKEGLSFNNAATVTGATVTSAAFLTSLTLNEIQTLAVANRTFGVAAAAISSSQCLQDAVS